MLKSFLTNGGSPATVVIDSCDGLLMVTVVSLLTGVCGGLQKLVVVPHTIFADCSLVFSGVFLGLFSVVCLERGVNPNDEIRFILVSSNPHMVAGVRSCMYVCMYAIIVLSRHRCDCTCDFSPTL